jgi:ElaB/YqjD/DUF883 family membrane-anchored ribosome-binding protein
MRPREPRFVLAVAPVRSTKSEVITMIVESESEQSVDETTSPITEAANKVDDAVKDTASAYLRKVGLNIDLEQIETSIRDKPLPSAAIAAAAGFILGGGMATRPGLAILAFLAWRVAKDTASNLVTGIIHGR